MHHAATHPIRPQTVSLALAALLALAGCGAEPADTEPLDENAEGEIVGAEPVEDHEPGQSPDAINDPVQEGPPLINRTGPDDEADIDIGSEADEY
ncbi:hypothetical protein [Erythrobacter sp.]|uniref:hypothetical protein n=1 Tax=Erythrobacter sp. TaxID=1042 RepID=UPI001425FB3A|nr:hypothetical protein [Erythrobacter sp.]QIQ87235.1 MAG: hypothetical protein G9473_11465 [Erythrobacter sp.]